MAAWMMNVREKILSLSESGKNVKRIRKIRARRRDALKPERKVKMKRGIRTTFLALPSPSTREMKGRKKDEITLRCIPESAKTWLTPFSLDREEMMDAPSSERARRSISERFSASLLCKGERRLLMNASAFFLISLKGDEDEGITSSAMKKAGEENAPRQLRLSPALTSSFSE